MRAGESTRKTPNVTVPLRRSAASNRKRLGRNGGNVGSLCLALALFGSLVNVSAAQQRLTTDQLKDGIAVRSAFRDVVRRVNAATVAILVADRQVSLGAIVSPDGFVLTKASELSSPVTCRLHDGRDLKAVVVGVHDRYDVALLKIDSSKLPSIEWADGPDPHVGQWLASAGMHEAPASVGIVSVPRRPIAPEKGVLGVQLSEGSPGPQVTHVVPNSAAARAGLRTGDVITRAADQPVTGPQDFDHLIRKFAPGDSIVVVVLRDNHPVSLRTVLGRSYGNFMSRGYWMNRMGGRLSQRRAGFPSVIQHDTVLDPEQCGGPVVDLSGRVVGINIARAGRVETFAVPADVAQTLIRELRANPNAAPASASKPAVPENSGAALVPPAP